MNNTEGERERESAREKVPFELEQLVERSTFSNRSDHLSRLTVDSLLNLLCQSD